MQREPVKSAVRALEILKLFSEERRPLKQKEIVVTLGYPQSSATFLLKSMVQMGFLSFDRNGRTYLPSPEVFRLGGWLSGFGYELLFQSGVVCEMLAELRDRTGETVSLATQSDIYTHWHRILERNLPCGLYLKEGATCPLTWSTYGCMLLSQQPEQQIDRVVRLINYRETDASRKVDVKRTMARLHEAKKNGYYHMRSTYRPEIASVATLLPVKVAGRDVAIGVGGMHDGILSRKDELVQCLSDTVDAYRADLKGAFGEPAPTVH